MMASLKVPSTALSLFFRHSRYDLYNFEPEKQLRLVSETFNLAILILFTELSMMVVTHNWIFMKNVNSDDT